MSLETKDSKKISEDAVAGLSDACATVYDKYHGGSFASEKLKKKYVEKIKWFVKTVGEDIISSVKDSTYLDFSSRAFSKLGFSSENYMKYNLVRHRLGLEYTKKITLDNLDNQIEEYSKVLVEGDKYKKVGDNRYSSEKTGAKVEIIGDKANFEYGPIKLEISSESFIPKKETKKELEVPEPLQEGWIRIYKKFLKTPHEFTGKEFELITGGIFKRMGCKIKSINHTRDGGVDLEISSPNSIGDSIDYVIQCKRYKERVPEPLIRDFVGSMLGKAVYKGIFVATSQYTGPAVQYVMDSLEKNKFLSLRLVDGEILSGWVKQLLDKGRIDGTRLFKKIEEYENPVVELIINKLILGHTIVKASLEDADIKMDDNAINWIYDYTPLLRNKLVNEPRIAQKYENKLKRLISTLESYSKSDLVPSKSREEANLLKETIKNVIKLGK